VKDNFTQRPKGAKEGKEAKRQGFCFFAPLLLQREIFAVIYSLRIGYKFRRPVGDFTSASHLSFTRK
jgi:hypothetical protein